MGWTRKSSRDARDRRRPSLEILETRQLLSSSTLNPDGSTNFDRIIGASAARSAYTVDGTGESVAVIDTGVDYKNAVLGGAIGPGHKVLTGVDFTNSPNNVLPTWQHGTGVAGIIAGNSSSYSGVAPGASIIPLRVFGDNNQGSFQEIAQALQWVVQNHNLYNITAVNLSVTDGNNYTSNVFANDGGVGTEITAAITHLTAIDIPVVVAAGNSFDGKAQGMGFPSVVPGVISVSATDAGDKLAGDAQRLGTGLGVTSATTIAAPGVGITAPSGDSGSTTEDGTSFATPQVTGSILLLQQMYVKAYHTLPSIPELDQLLQEGAVPVFDSATGLTIGRLDVLNSAQILNQQITNTTTGTSGGGSTSPVTTPPTTTGTTTSMMGGSTTTTTSSGSTTSIPITQVFVNGVSLGNYSTAALAAKYPSLFTFLKGPVPTLRIWVTNASSLNLGPSIPSAAASKTVKIVKAKVPTTKVEATKKAATTKSVTTKAVMTTVHAAAVSTTTPAVHKPAPKKKSSSPSILSYLFPFKF